MCAVRSGEGRQAERAAPLAGSMRRLKSEAGAGRQHERGAVARSTPALLYCAPARAPTDLVFVSREIPNIVFPNYIHVT